MLFVEIKTLRHSLDASKRIQLLESTQQKNFIPAIRSARLKCFEHVLLGTDHVREMETELADSNPQERDESFIRGDLFCLNDHVLFLIFDDNSKASPLIRAGIIYETRTAEPFRKLEAFCRDVRDLLSGEIASQNADGFPQWESGKLSMPGGFKRFVAKQDTDSLYTSLRKETMTARVRAASILEDTGARMFLRRAKEASVEGYAAKLLAGDSLGSYQHSIERLSDVGLVEREVQVSCRKTGHALFRLPNAHALAVVTVSDATCSECGVPVADEKVEEVIAPTRLAASLLEDGSWLISRLHHLLRELGIPESEIALGPSEGDGYGQMMANICGESFLIVARDGDLTPAFARWAIDLEIETEASHLVVVATGRVHNHAGVLLHNHARRRIRAGRDFELILADDAAGASEELRLAFERVSQRILAEQLSDLDSGLGLGISRLIMTKFKFLRTAEESPRWDVSDDEAPRFSSPAAPLVLAASASANSVEVFGPEKFVAAEPAESSAVEHNDVDASLNSVTHGY